MVESRSLTQEAVDSSTGSGFEFEYSNPFLKQYNFLSLNLLNSVKSFRENLNVVSIQILIACAV